MTTSKKICFSHQFAALLIITNFVANTYVSGANGKLNCRPQYYTHKAIQTDSNGRRCWDEVKIKSCSGHCLSYEIADWQFPYKESHHPVCVHGDRKHTSTILRQCDSGVEPSTEVYRYVEAQNCKCKVCSSEDTSCEWLPDVTAFEELLQLQRKFDNRNELDIEY